MRRSISVVAVLCLCSVLSLIVAPASAQEAGSDSQRKLINRVVPMYPPLARTMNVHGSVRLQAIVAPNGTVRTIEGKGGHPLLVQAAENAVLKWKWVPAKQETRENVEIRFNPD
jgi:protein TonB